MTAKNHSLFAADNNINHHQNITFVNSRLGQLPSKDSGRMMFTIDVPLVLRIQNSPKIQGTEGPYVAPVLKEDVDNHHIICRQRSLNYPRQNTRKSSKVGMNGLEMFSIYLIFL